MQTWIVVFLAAFVAGVAAQSCAPCASMKWATCDGSASSCVCQLALSEGFPQPVNCSKLIPKCYLMKAEMYRARKGLSTRSGSKPTEHAIVDNDGIYDPDCENDGRFKAKQCNQTQTCWCVNSAGVRRTDKGDTNLKCDKLVETYWIRLQLTHQPVNGQLNENDLKGAIGSAMESRYTFDKSMLDTFTYDPAARMMLVDIKKPIGNRNADLATIAYYMEKDVKVLPLFTKQDNLTVSVNSQNQNLQMDSILVYYVDEEAPTMTMQHLSGGIIAVIVVVVLAVVIGLLVLFFARKRLNKKYTKTQQREMEAM